MQPSHTKSTSCGISTCMRHFDEKQDRILASWLLQWLCPGRAVELNVPQQDSLAGGCFVRSDCSSTVNSPQARQARGKRRLVWVVVNLSCRDVQRQGPQNVFQKKSRQTDKSRQTGKSRQTKSCRRRPPPPPPPPPPPHGHRHANNSSHKHGIRPSERRRRLGRQPDRHALNHRGR